MRGRPLRRRRELLKAGRSRQQAEAKPDAIALIHKAIEAKGGLARLKGVRSMQITAATFMITPAGQAESTEAGLGLLLSHMQSVFPDRFRVDIRQSGHTATGMVVGDELTVRTPDGVVGSPAESAARRIE